MNSIINLSDNWKMQTADKKISLSVNLPVTNYTALLNAGIIADPFYGENEKKLLWVAEKDWVFKKSFELSADAVRAEIVSLTFDGVDTLCDIKVNGKLFIKTDNAHFAYKIDAKKFLTAGKNEIELYIHSPLAYAKERADKLSLPHIGGSKGFNLVRKPAYHYGWDWGPKLPVSGITGGIYLTVANCACIDDIRVAQRFTDGVCDLNITAELKNVKSRGTAIFTVTDPNGLVVEVAERVMERSKDTVTADIKIDNPSLWWARGMKRDSTGKQPLYTVKAEIREDGKKSDEKEIKIGLRSVELCRDKISDGEDFAFIINGVRIFAKGANWIPPDVFIDRANRSVYEKYIKAAYDANFNMIRVWGGGYYPPNEFFDLCDEYGILVWQDFGFACAPYPVFETEYRASCIKEITYNVKRIRNHASLCLWCGNNEIEACSTVWRANLALNRATEEFFYRVIPDLLKTLDPVTPYWYGTPSGGKYMKNVSSDLYGDTHIWNVWHGMRNFDYFLKRPTRFCSEFGFESLPGMDAINSFAKPEDLDLSSPVMKNHQKCLAGNSRMLYYMIENYRIPRKFEHLLYLSQLTQADSTRWAVEHWRRRSGKSNGALYWQYNDCWPVASWSSVDYTGKYKALQYMAREFYKPIAVSILNRKGTCEVFATNDSADEFNGNISARIIGFNGEIYAGKRAAINLPALSTVKIAEFKLSAIKNFDKKSAAAAAEIIDQSGLKIASATELFVSDRKAKLKAPVIQKAFEEDDGSVVITLKSDTYTRRVYLDIPGVSEPFDMNFFDMEANNEYKVRIKASGLTMSFAEKNLKITTITDIEPKYTRFTELLTKLKISLIPINFANRIVYRFFM